MYVFAISCCFSATSGLVFAGLGGPFDDTSRPAVSAGFTSRYRCLRDFPRLFPGGPKYDKATETTVKGSVEELKLVPPAGPKPVAYLTLKTGPDKDKDTAQIYLCPKKFLDDMGITFKADDAVQVVGSKVKQDTGDVILAREVTLNGETLTLRFQDGKPAW